MFVKILLSTIILHAIKCEEIIASHVRSSNNRKLLQLQSTACPNDYESCEQWPKNCTGICAIKCCIRTECIILPLSVLNFTRTENSSLSNYGKNTSSPPGDNSSDSCACVTIHCAGRFELAWTGSILSTCVTACSPSNNSDIGRNCSVVCCGTTPTCVATNSATSVIPGTTAIAVDTSQKTTPVPTAPPATSPPPEADTGQVVVRNNITVVNITTVVTEYVRNSTVVGAQEELNRLVEAFRRFAITPPSRAAAASRYRESGWTVLGSQTKHRSPTVPHVLSPSSI
jgi:hypothetical protein